MTKIRNSIDTYGRAAGSPATCDVSIIVVSYNTRDLTLACLRSIFAETAGLEFEVLIVDNASTDGSANAIASEFPQSRLFAHRENIGFAAANNVAAGKAKGDYILLLNPDTVVLGGAIQNLVAFANRNPGAGIYGGRTLNGDQSLNPTSCWGRPTLWGAFCRAAGLSAAFSQTCLFNPEEMPDYHRDFVREVDIVTGCFLLIRRRLWEELGGFDPAFFMYCEEADLCLRAAKRGQKCLICPEATIIHYGGASEPCRADKTVRLFKAKTQLFRKHWPPGWALSLVSMLRLWALNRTIIYGLLRCLGPRFAKSYEAWRTVWGKRAEWS